MEDSVKTAKEIKDIFDRFQALQRQVQHPIREGMIDALKGAAEVAFSEVSQSEYSHGNIYSVPWESIPDAELYQKLPQYQKALLSHCIHKYGESVVNHYIDTQLKNRN